MPGSLLIALVKNGRNDQVLSCNVDAVKQLGKHFDDVINKKSADIWPDEGFRYRVDDLHVLDCRKPKLNIREKVVVNGHPIDVVTEKYPIGDDLLLVLVYRDEGTPTTPYQAGFSVAIVRCPEGWFPDGVDDVPTFCNSNVEGYEAISGQAQMQYEVAEAVRNARNGTKLLDGKFDGSWHVITPPGYDE